MAPPHCFYSLDHKVKYGAEGTPPLQLSPHYLAELLPGLLITSYTKQNSTQK